MICRNGNEISGKHPITRDTKGAHIFTTTVNIFQKNNPVHNLKSKFLLGYSKIKPLKVLLRELHALFWVPTNENMYRKRNVFLEPLIQRYIHAHSCKNSLQMPIIHLITTTFYIRPSLARENFCRNAH